MSGVAQYVQGLSAQKAAGTLFNTYTTAKSVINPTEIVPINGNYLTIGSRICIKVFGGLSNVVTAAPTFTFQIMLGSIVAFSTGAITTNATANTLLPFELEANLRVDSIGSGTAAKFMGRARVLCDAFAALSVARLWPTTSPTLGNGFDSTIANNLDFWCGISASNAGNGIQVYDYEVLQSLG
jgi:hypothetical protein